MQPVAQPLETLIVDEDRVVCDGGGELGHPRVYLNLGPKGEIECPYCGRRYVKSAAAKAGHGH
jgi:uncharacterized Zn-finger protein